MGRAQPIFPGIRIQSLVDCFGLGAHVCVCRGGVFSRAIDMDRPGISGSVQGPSPSPDWGGLGPESVF